MNPAQQQVMRLFKANGLKAGQILYPKQIRHFTWRMTPAEHRSFEIALEELLRAGLIELADEEMGAPALTKTGEATLARLD